MTGVPAMDITALRSLETVYETCRKNGVSLLISHVTGQPLNMMRKSGFASRIGEDAFCANIDEALRRADSLCESCA